MKLNKFLIEQLNLRNENERVISIAGNDSPLSWSGISFDIPAPLLSIDEYLANILC